MQQEPLTFLVGPMETECVQRWARGKMPMEGEAPRVPLQGEALGMAQHLGMTTKIPHRKEAPRSTPPKGETSKPQVGNIA